jgi:3'(2'), 5'-bisphosphate nucleotidase
MQEFFGEVEFIQMGSALKFFDLALGKADVYPRFAPTMEWDIAAGQAIIEALGGTVLHAETNQPLTYNKESLYNPFFIVKTKPVIEHLNK